MMPKLPEPDEYLCFFDEGGMQDSNEMGYSKQAVRAIQEEAYKAGMAAAVESCAQEAEHWQRISNPGHACGKYIAGAIRAVHSKEVK